MRRAGHTGRGAGLQEVAQRPPNAVHRHRDAGADEAHDERGGGPRLPPPGRAGATGGHNQMLVEGGVNNSVDKCAMIWSLLSGIKAPAWILIPGREGTTHFSVIFVLQEFFSDWHSWVCPAFAGIVLQSRTALLTDRNGT